jgi:membrane dipeptidase
MNGSGAAQNTIAETVARLHREAPLTDVHVHPSLKLFLFNRRFDRHYMSGKVFNPFASRPDLPMLLKGGVGVVWSAAHLPERQLFDDCFLMRLAALLLVPAYAKLTRGGLFDRCVEMMQILENEVARRPDLAEVARSTADVARIRQAGRIAVVHTVEGAHVLEGRIERLDQLAARGVAMITLTHFYRNGLVSQVDAIPNDLFIKKICRFNFETGGTPALSDFGREVLHRMAALKILVDVTHCHPEARAAVFQETGTSRPLVASHTGVARYHADPYNLRDDEIRHIAATGGAVGVILMPYWLSSLRPRNGRSIVAETMDHIHHVTGSWDHVMLGTDFDGFTDPPDDLEDASRLPRLTELLLQRGLSESDVSKILGGNAARVLKAAWR